MARLAIVLLGYVAAALLGAAAVWLKNRGISEADQAAMSGMFAFGDSVTFLAVAALVAIAPTVLAFHWLRARPGFFRVYSTASLVASLTGLLAAVLLLARPQALGLLTALAPLRVLSGPLFLAVFAPGLLPSAGPYRSRSLLACAFELCTMASFLVFLMLAR